MGHVTQVAWPFFCIYMTPEELQHTVNDRGELLRADIDSVLRFYNDSSSSYVNMQLFLSGVTCLSEDQKIMVLNDLESYAI